MTPDEARALLYDDPVAQRLLDSANPARMAYVARDGTPRVVPVGFLWTGTTIVVGTVPGSAKVRALEANPSVALTIDTSPPVWPPNALFVRGTAEVTIVEGVFPEYVDASRKVTPPEAFGEWEQGENAYDEKTPSNITTTRWKNHHFYATLPTKAADHPPRKLLGGMGAAGGGGWGAQRPPGGAAGRPADPPTAPPLFANRKQYLIFITHWDSGGDIHTHTHPHPQSTTRGPRRPARCTTRWIARSRSSGLPTYRMSRRPCSWAADSKTKFP